MLAPVATVVLGLVAIALGGPLTVLVLRLVDRRAVTQSASPRFPMLHDDSLVSARNTLRGGAWIGALERVAIYIAIAVGFTGGLALALALKGLGRYPELRAGDNPAVAERFIIGTFVSVLWACACGIAQRSLVA